MKTIIVETYAGLGNRFQCLAALTNLYKNTGFKCIVLWRVDDSCLCRYEDLLEPPKNFKVINIWNTGKKRNPVKTLIGKCLTGIAKVLSGRHFTMTELTDVTWGEGYEAFLSMFDESRVNYILSNSSFTRYFSEDLDFVKPNEEVRRLGEKLYGRIGPDTIGIHIRRTDHVHCIENSPVELFYERIADYIKREKNISFLLCTDDPLVERDIIERFGREYFIVYEKVQGRDSTRGIQDALVEMTALSKCREIIASAGSTFSHVASKLSDIELIKIKKDQT